MTETRNLLVQEPERVSQTDTATQERQTGAARMCAQNHLETRLAGTFGLTQQDPHRGRGPTPSPWGRVLGAQSDLDAEVGQMHAALDGDAVELVEGHAVCILHEDVLVHHHLLT